MPLFGDVQLMVQHQGLVSTVLQEARLAGSLCKRGFLVQVTIQARKALQRLQLQQLPLALRHGCQIHSKPLSANYMTLPKLAGAEHYSRSPTRKTACEDIESAAQVRQGPQYLNTNTAEQACIKRATSACSPAT